MIVPDTVIGSDSLALAQLFGQFEYIVPEYQRGYEWTDEQLEQLWKDVCKTRDANRRERRADVEAHFLGAVVVICRPDDKARLEVVDGQQRLASLSMLCSVMIGFVQELEETTQKMMLSAELAKPLFRSMDGVPQPTVLLNKEGEFYEESYVKRLRQEERLEYWGQQDLGKRPTAELLKGAGLYFHAAVAKELATADGSEKRSRVLVELQSALMDCFIVIRLMVHRPKMAYRLFESLNFHGLRLTQADLVKNEVLHRAASRQDSHDKAVADWKATENSVESQSLLDRLSFLHHYHISAIEELKVGELFEGVLRHLDDGEAMGDESDRVLRYLGDLRKHARHLAKLSAYDDWPSDVGEWLQEIHETLHVRFAIPLLLAAADCFRAPEDKAKLAGIVRLTRDFCFRFVTVGGHTPEILRRVVSRAALELRRSEGDPSVVEAILLEQAPDGLFREQFGTFSPGAQKRGFYVLDLLERHIAKGAGTRPYSQSVRQHLEHIAPRTPDPDEWAHLVDDDRYEHYVNRLGNLLILESDINQHIKNKGLGYKISNDTELDYAHSRLRLPPEVVSMVKTESGIEPWSFESIEKRQEDLANRFALQIWPLRLPEDLV